MTIICYLNSSSPVGINSVKRGFSRVFCLDYFVLSHIMNSVMKKEGVALYLKTVLQIPIARAPEATWFRLGLPTPRSR